MNYPPIDRHAHDCYVPVIVWDQLVWPGTPVLGRCACGAIAIDRSAAQQPGNLHRGDRHRTRAGAE